MPKPSQGRFAGLWGMTTFTAEQLFAWSAAYEATLQDPDRADDPKWLRRRADRLRRVTEGKEAAREHKRRQRHCGRPQRSTAFGRSPPSRGMRSAIEILAPEQVR